MDDSEGHDIPTQEVTPERQPAAEAIKAGSYNRTETTRLALAPGWPG